MAISSLDTLDIAKRLKGAGFSEAQAEAVTTVFRDVRTTDLAPLATKADIERLQAATQSDIQRLEIATKSEIEAVRADIRRLEAKSDSQIELLRRDLTIRLGSMIVVGVGLLLAAKFFG